MIIDRFRGALLNPRFALRWLNGVSVQETKTLQPTTCPLTPTPSYIMKEREGGDEKSSKMQGIN